MVKTISYMDVIKECMINIDLPVVSMGYAHKQLGDYHGIAWLMPFALTTLCVVNPLLTGGFSHRLSIVRSFVVWSLLSALLVELWCLISDFRITGLVCNVSIGSKGFMFSFMFARTSSWWNGRFASQLKTPDAHMMSRVDRGLLCVICHSVIDDITSPAYGETGQRWIPAAMDAWNQHLDSRPKGCGETPVMWWNHRSPVNSRRKGSVELSYGGPVCGDSITIDQQCRALDELFN